MTFDLPTISALVQRIANALLPGWGITCELAPSIEANHGALACVYSTPERQLAHVVVAPHPPNESVEESVAHELTHAVLSPLTKLIELSPAAVMIEEQIVERLGKLIANAPVGMARAISKALSSPRTDSPTLRKRISALAIGRRNETRKRMDPKALAALAMEGGQFAAMEGLDPAVADWIKKAIEAMAGGGAPESEPPMREDDPAKPKPGDPAMREEDVPEPMRKMYRMAAKSSAMLLRESIRMRLHNARTVDNIALDEATIADLSGAQSLEQWRSVDGLSSRRRHERAAR
jgi:hypothetical protein